MADHPNVHVISHPLIQQRLTLARDRSTKVEQFRALLGQIASLMAFELTRDYPTVDVEVETPLAMCQGKKLAVNLTLVPILRAGLGMADGIPPVDSGGAGRPTSASTAMRRRSSRSPITTSCPPTSPRVT